MLFKPNTPRSNQKLMRIAHSSVMIGRSVYILWLALHIAQTIGSPITFELQKGQKECFYTLTTDLDCSISYYFAVQQGNSNDMDIDYEVFGPDDKYSPIVERRKERQGEWSFLAEHKGEYRFCFDGGPDNNKVIDLQITNKCNRDEDARSQKRLARKEQRNLRKSESDPLKESLENSVDQIERRLHQLENTMEYYQVRSLRNHGTVRSTDRRIVTFSVYGIFIIALMSMGQVSLLRWVFQKARRHVV